MLAANGKRVRLAALNHKPTEFHASWLAHYCPCGACKQPSSGQRLERISSSASAATTIQSVKLTADALEVRFSPTHVGTFPLAWLDKHRYDEDAVQTKRRAALTSTGSSSSFVKVLQYNGQQDKQADEDVLYWLQHAVSGVCVIEGTPLADRFLLDFIRPTLCEPSHKLYGETFVVEALDESINVAYSQHKLEPHQDLAYYESPPGLQFLHCQEFDQSIQGGESTFVDGVAAAEELRKRNPAAFDVLCRVPCTFQKDHVQRADPAKMFYNRPHIHTDHLGAVVAVFWAPPFEGPLHVSSSSDDVEAYFDAYEQYRALLCDDAEFLQRHAVKFRTKPGNLVIFNNRRFLHGREAFTVPKGGSQRRKLHGCYLDMDRVLNRIRYLESVTGGGGGGGEVLTTRPGNTSYL